MEERVSIFGAETLFSIPVEQFKPSSIASVEKLLNSEGYDVSFERLDYLFSQNCAERERQIYATRKEMTLNALVASVLDALEIDDVDIIISSTELLAGDFLSSIKPYPGVYELLSSLKEKGRAIALLWNAPMGIPHSLLSERMEYFSLRDMFDDIQYSSENGAVRPHARPLRYALSNLNASAAEATVVTGLLQEQELLQRLGVRRIIGYRIDAFGTSCNSVEEMVALL
jgi:FMN phosphatase YigB (HAD superfamily)